MRPPVFTLPVSLEVTFLVADMAEMAVWVRNVERRGANLLDLYHSFVAMILLTRALVDA
jgi:D-amino peptidase